MVLYTPGNLSCLLHTQVGAEMKTRQELILEFMLALATAGLTVIVQPATVYEHACALADKYLERM